MSVFSDLFSSKGLFYDTDEDSSSYSIETDTTNTTTDSGEDLDKFAKTIKHVRFSTICHIILIPSRQEYAGFCEDLWYNRTDYLRFRFECR